MSLSVPHSPRDAACLILPKDGGTIWSALAADAEINQRIFKEEGDLIPTSRTWANAQAFASMNNAFLAQYEVNAIVTGIAVNDEEDTGLVHVSANLDRLFPSIVPDIIIVEMGKASVRSFSR